MVLQENMFTFPLVLLLDISLGHLHFPRTKVKKKKSPLLVTVFTKLQFEMFRSALTWIMCAYELSSAHV